MVTEASALVQLLPRNSSFIPSVTMPSVPSAPIKRWVPSKPAEHFRARRRVLMTSPDGKTTVYETSFSEAHRSCVSELISMLTAFRNHSALAVP